MQAMKDCKSAIQYFRKKPVNLFFSNHMKGMFYVTFSLLLASLFWLVHSLHYFMSVVAGPVYSMPCYDSRSEQHYLMFQVACRLQFSLHSSQQHTQCAAVQPGRPALQSSISRTTPNKSGAEGPCQTKH
jgi:hypothetical protein